MKRTCITLNTHTYAQASEYALKMRQAQFDARKDGRSVRVYYIDEEDQLARIKNYIADNFSTDKKGL